MIVGSPTKLNLIPSGVMPVVYINQGDAGYDKEFLIYNGDSPYNVPAGVSATIRGTKADGYGVTEAAALTEGSNLVTVTITEQMVAAAGENLYELVFVDTNDLRVASINMVWAVKADALGDAVISESDLDYATTVMNELQSVQAFKHQLDTNTDGLAAETAARIAADNTLQTNINLEAGTRASVDTTLQQNITNEAAARATADNSLQQQINQIVAPSGGAPSAAEVTAARVGADGVTYSTLGDAIRTQVTNLDHKVDNRNINSQNANIEQVYYPDFVQGRIDSHTDPAVIERADTSRCITATINNMVGYDTVTFTAASGFNFAIWQYTGTAESTFFRNYGWETTHTFDNVALKNFRILVKKTSGTITPAEASAAISVVLKRHSIPQRFEEISFMHSIRDWQKALYKPGSTAYDLGYRANANYVTSDAFRCVPGDTIHVTGGAPNGQYLFYATDRNGNVTQYLQATGINNLVSGDFTFTDNDMYFWLQCQVTRYNEGGFSVNYTSQYDATLLKTAKQIDGIITLTDFDDITEVGNINAGFTPPYFTGSTTRVRIMQDHPVHLPAGAKIYLTDYSAARFYTAYVTADGTWGFKAWTSSGEFVAPVEADYWVLLTAVPEATVTDKRILTSLLRMQYLSSMYDYVQNEIIPGQRTDWTIKSINHRGYGRIAPENTIPAFALSAKLGWKYIETDIRFTSDGVPVLLHDDTINRTARNADGTAISETININNITYAQALTYDFGIWMGAQYAGTKIPTLEELAAFCKRVSLDMYLEIKDETGNRVEQVVNIVKRAGMLRHTSWVAFSYSAIQKVTAVDSKARIGLITDTVDATIIDTLDTLKESENEVFADWNVNNVTSAGCQLLANAGYDLEVWTANDIQGIESLDPYVSGITSDYVNAGQALYNDFVLGIRHERW